MPLRTCLGPKVSYFFQTCHSRIVLTQGQVNDLSHRDAESQTADSMSSEYAIPKGSTVLITGVTGFIASHIADQVSATLSSRCFSPQHDTLLRWSLGHAHQRNSNDAQHDLHSSVLSKYPMHSSSDGVSLDTLSLGLHVMLGMSDFRKQ